MTAETLGMGKRDDGFDNLADCLAAAAKPSTYICHLFGKVFHDNWQNATIGKRWVDFGGFYSSLLTFLFFATVFF